MTNRLADEATYFGAVAEGAASRDDEVAELRQQLADVKTVSDHNLKVYQEAAEKLRQQVDLLRDELERIANMDDGYGEHVCCDSIIGKPHSEWCNVWKTLCATDPKQ